MINVSGSQCGKEIFEINFNYSISISTLRLDILLIAQGISSLQYKIQRFLVIRSLLALQASTNQNYRYYI